MRQLRKTSILIAALAMVALLAMGCSDDDKSPVNSTTPAPTMDIVETAAANGNFTTLLAAATAADLVDALKSDGPLTVFAPTDEAFAALPEGTVEALLDDIDALTAILTYHVVAGSFKASQVLTLSSVLTLNGAELTITVSSDGKVKVDNANVIITDIAASNGIIHVIDAVVIPSAEKAGAASLTASWRFGSYSFGGGWIADAIRDGRLQWLTSRLSLYNVSRLAGLKTLNVAVKAADLSNTLKRGGPFTLFGPTDEAFGAIPASTLESLLQNPSVLADILLYHVVVGVVTASDVVSLTEATMANGQTVNITVGNGVMINNANVVVTDIPAKNGVLHIIDGVLIP